MLKPKVATIAFDNHEIRPIKMFDSTDVIYETLPFNWQDENKQCINENEIFDEYETYSDKIDEDDDTMSLIDGELATEGDLIESIHQQDDDEDLAIINSLKSYGILNSQSSFSPSLTSVPEESKYDLSLYDLFEGEVRTPKQTRIINKRYIQKDIRKLDAQISTNFDEKESPTICKVQLRLPSDSNINNTAQNDGGANRSVTNQQHLLLNYKTIDPYPVGGVKDGEPAIHCTGRGLLPWRSKNGEIVLIRCYYSADVAGTIISPTDIVVQHKERYRGWNMNADVKTGRGTFTLLSSDGINHTDFDTYMENNLWFHYLQPVTHKESNTLKQSVATVKRLTDMASFELWHHRLGHPGQKVMDCIHDHVTGVPKLRRNQFYSCAACLSGKFKKTHIGEVKSYQQAQNTEQSPDAPSDCKIGQHLHMDFGFVRGSEYCKIDNDGKLVTSIDNYRSYLLVIDRASRYIWIFLTKTKHPPISQVQGLLAKFKNLYPNSSITTDQGKELGKSKAFQLMAKEHGYTLKTTGSDSSAQNGLAEKPNQDLARIMRCLLFSAGMDSRYWSYALRHAVYLKNRLPHFSLPGNVTPYQKMNNKKPDLSRLKIFGSKVQIKDSTKRRTKLDPISTTGIFMTYKGTNKIAYVTNTDGTHEKASAHLAFDEAHMSAPSNRQPPMAQALQQAGYRKEPFVDVPHPLPLELPNTHTIRFKPLSEDATIPEKGTTSSAGYDLFSAQNTVIEPYTQKLIHTDLEMEIPEGYGGLIKARSGLALKKQIDIKAGVIDSDYRGEVGIIVYNGGKDNFAIAKGDKLAQMVMIPVPKFQQEVVDTLSTTARDKGGFGSTGTSTIKDKIYQPVPSIPTTSTALPDSQSPRTAAAALLDGNYNPTDPDDILPIYNAVLSDDPFYNKQTIQLEVKGRHPTLGLQLNESPNWDDRVIISGCALGTPSRKVRDWIKRVKGSTLLQINDTDITTPQQATEVFKQLLTASPKPSTINIVVDNEEKEALHRDEGIPMLYFDQLAMISSHLDSIKYNTTATNNNKSTITKINDSSELSTHYMEEMIKAYELHGTINAAKAILPKNKRKGSRLTRRKLKIREDWNDWRDSERKQLNQYEDQDTFGKPCKLPAGANVLDLLWTYMIKDDGRKKARCVCNGKPSNKNTAIFGYTFAKMLDHVGSRIFWAAVASKNFIVRGADASNAFAEADAPKIPLYVRIDTPFKEWWTEHKKRDPIPDNFVLPVKKALQGHPESSRSWALLIDKILREKLKFKPTTHEPCLYIGNFNGEEVLFLRQVDDFAVAARNESTTVDVIKAIDKEMSIDIKDLGLLTRYNGVDIVQSKHYVKLNNPTYINKVLEGHTWMMKNDYIADKPIPMKSENEYSRNLEKATGPSTEKERIELQLQMGFNYRQAIGELIYAMVTCRPDISYPLIKLSQYSTNPSREHYEAVKHIFYYLRATVNDGIYYWRKQPHPTLPSLPLPLPSTSEQTTKHDDDTTTMIAAVDADWAGDTQHRRSVTGIILRLSGGTILYKTKFQETIAMSSTEAEFAAACDAGKSILYVRSILDEIGINQDEATTLYIDNNGALMMGNAQQPTRRTRHMDIKKFVLIDWVQHDLLLMKRITSTDNYSDLMTKALGRTLHWKHSDYIMGRIRPTYTDAYILTYLHSCKQSKTEENMKAAHT